MLNFIDIVKRDLTASDKARIDSILFLPNENRIIVTTTEGYVKDTQFIAQRKGKTFVFDDKTATKEYTKFLGDTKFDTRAVEQKVDNLYDFTEFQSESTQKLG